MTNAAVDACVTTSVKDIVLVGAILFTIPTAMTDNWWKMLLDEFSRNITMTS